MSACTIVWAFGANFVGSPVTRSSNRMPSAKITSALDNRKIRALPAVHAEHPEIRRIAGVGATQAVQRRRNRRADPRRERTRKISVAPDQRVPPPTISTGRCAPCKRGNRGVERLRIGTRPFARRRVLGNCGFALRLFECAQDIGRKIDEHRPRARTAWRGETPRAAPARSARSSAPRCCVW